MKVIDLLAAYEDKTFTDVVIIDGNYNGTYDANDILAKYIAKDNTHDEWGRLDYLNTFTVNPLEKWFDYRVKSFDVLNDFDVNGIHCIYITI